MKDPDALGAQLQKGTTPLLVLSVIGDGELYGYQIAQFIRERSGGAFAPSEGSLYPTLHRLEADGALDATWRENEHGPRRRYYRLTSGGHRLLADHRAQWSAFATSIGRVTLPEASGG
jgi:PadR family transcriptional regulator PadR